MFISCCNNFDSSDLVVLVRFGTEPAIRRDYWVNNTMDVLLGGLRAVAEPTRLRLLALCAHAELTVSELTQILGQSQPRVSRHLKLLCEAGVLDRHREGTWAFYRLSGRGECAHLGRTLVDLIPADDEMLTRDLSRLENVKRVRAEAAADYFRANAEKWNEIRSLHVPEEEVEEALLHLFESIEMSDFVDIGTGTGRVLELFGPKIKNGIGVDLSPEMLTVARAALQNANLSNCQVRQADMYNLPIGENSVDGITLHQVLHYADDPAAVIAEGGRILRPGGRMVMVDFAPHDLETLRDEHAHRRLGFEDSEVENWFKAAGLKAEPPLYLEGDPLTVVLWPAIAREQGGKAAT